MLLTFILVHYCIAYTPAQFKLDFDSMFTDPVGQQLIKEVRSAIRKTHDQSEFMIYLNRLESSTAQLNINAFNDACDADLLDIEGQKQLIVDSKYRIALLQYKTKDVASKSKGMEDLIAEKQFILDETQNTVSELEQLRQSEADVFDKRRNEIMLGGSILRRSKYLIGSLIPKIPDLAAQTKFAKTDTEAMTTEAMNQQLLQLKSQAADQLGGSPAYELIVDSLSQLNSRTREDQITGNLEHVTSVINLLAQIEDDLNNINIVFLNTEQARQELHERVTEHASQIEEQLNAQITELSNYIEEIVQACYDYDEEIKAETERLESLQLTLDEYIDAHESRQNHYNEEIHDKVLAIKLIRMMKEDFLHDFHSSRRYILSSRFHIKKQ